MIVEGSSAPARRVAKAMAQALQREELRLNARVAVSVQVDPAGPEPQDSLTPGWEHGNEEA